MKIKVLTIISFLFLISIAGSGQVNCGGVAVTAFDIFNCGVGQSPQLRFTVDVCSNQATAGNWTISYPGGTNNVSFFVQQACPNSFNCGVTGQTINLPLGFDCSSININNVIITNTAGSSPCAFQLTSSCSTLPVNFISFDVKRYNNKVIYEWVTASEENVNKFILLGSVDGIEYQSVDEVNAKGNGSSTNQTYNIVKNSNLGYLYYKVKSLDNDGSVGYS